MTKDVVDLLRQVRRAIERVANGPERIVVAVSGGPDSMALLHLLQQIVGSQRLIVAHLDHGWRATSVQEALFVRKTAVSLHIPCHLERIDINRVAQDKQLSLETASRLVRYQFLARVARCEGVRLVATGHHGDDQAETVLMHLLRGSGLAGLQGMSLAAPFPENGAGLTLIRPLLAASRLQIEAFCQAEQLAFVEDPSNEDITFLRNRIRHELLPYLTSYNEQISAHLQNLAATSAADYEYLQMRAQDALPIIILEQDIAAGWIRMDTAKWLAQPLSLQRLMLKTAVLQLTPSTAEISFATLEQARQIIEGQRVGAQSTLPASITLTVGYSSFTLSLPDSAPPILWPQLPSPETILLCPVPGAVTLENGWTLTASLCSTCTMEQIKANADPWQAFIQTADHASLHIRSRQVGERFQPLGLEGKQAKLKKAMIDQKVPSQLRACWPLVCNQAHLLWFPGYLVDERARVTDHTQPIIQLQCRPSTS